MPLLTFDEPYNDLIDVVEPDAPAMVGEYDVWDIYKAGFSRESDITGIVDAFSDAMPTLTEEDRFAFDAGGFTGLDYIKGTRFDDDTMRHLFVDMKSPAQAEWRMRQIDREMQRIKVLDASPFYHSLPAEILGSLFSFTTAADVAVVGKAVKIPATVARKALALGGYNMAMTGVQELVLQQQQEFRHWTESVGAGVTAGLIGGGVGAATGHFVRKAGGSRVDVADELGLDKTEVSELTLPDGPRGLADADVTNLESGGAAKAELDMDLNTVEEIVNSPDLDEVGKERALLDLKAADYEVATPIGVFVGTLGGVLKKLMPDVRMATDNEWGTARRFAGHMFNHTVDTVGKLEGKTGVPLDTILRRDDKLIDWSIGRIIDDHYVDYVGTKGVFAAGRANKQAGKMGKMSRTEFGDLIRRNIASGFEASTDPLIDKASKELKKFSDVFGRRAVQLGYLEGGEDGLPVPPLGDKAWFYRSWSRSNAMRMQEEEWVEGLIPAAVKNLHRHAAQEAEEVKLKIRQVEDEITELKAREAEEIGYLLDEARINRAREEGLTPTPQAPLSKLGKLTTAEETKITVVYKARRKEQIKKMRRDAKKMPFHKRLEAVGTEEGLEKLRQEYRGHYRSILDPNDAGQYADYTGRGVKMQGDQVQPVERRSMDIATADLPPGYLDEDAMQGLAGSIKRLNRVMNVAESAHVPGEPNFQYWFNELQHERNIKMAELKKKFDAGAMTDKQYGKAIESLKDDYTSRKDLMVKSVQALYDIHKAPENQWLYNLGSSLKSIAVLNMLGSVMFATLPELTSPIGSVGVRNYLRNVTEFALNNAEWRRMTKAQREEFILGVETAQFMRMSEIGEFDQVTGKIHKGIRQTADVTLDKVFGLGVWTRAVTAGAGVMVQSRVGRTLLKFKGMEAQPTVKETRINSDGTKYTVEVAQQPKIKGISKSDIEQLGAMGITRDMIPGLAEQVKAHHKKLKFGTVDMRIGEWADQDAAASVRDAVIKEVNNTIIEPGTGAVAFAGRGPVGSMVMQFKQFLLASSSKYFMQDMQRIFRRDWRGAERQLAFLGMGQLVLYLKTLQLDGIEEGNEKYQNMGWGQRLVEGASYGGGLGAISELVSGTYEGFVGDTVRYGGNRTIEGMVFGPSLTMGVSALSDLTGLAQVMMGEPELAQHQLRSMRRKIPFNNYVLTRPAFDYAEDKMYEILAP